MNALSSNFRTPDPIIAYQYFTKVPPYFNLSYFRAKIFRYANEKGVEWFFNREERRGQCFKFTESVKKEAQTMIDKGRTPYSTAKELGLSESTIYYHVRKGNLKKKN